MVALWRKLAARYKDEPAIGAYDLINEPNWDFDGPGGDHGCKDEKQTALWDFYKELTTAVRQIDQRHMIILEGNCWGNNYKGMPAVWDDNTGSVVPQVLERQRRGLDRDGPEAAREHGPAAVAGRKRRELQRLVPRRHRPGRKARDRAGRFWPLKKIGFNQPLRGDGLPKLR